MVEVLYGKVASGKTTYANSKEDVIVFNVDELLNSLNSECEGPKRHKEIEMAIIKYYISLIIKLDKLGIDTILDHGLWYKDERAYIKKVLDDNGVDHKFILFDESYDIRLKRLEERNKEALRKIPLEKLAFFDSLFEEDDEV